MNKKEFIKNKLLSEIRTQKPSLESLIVLENGKTLIEEYFKGTPSTLRCVASMEKSIILATSIGILLKKKLVSSLKTTLGDIFPQQILSYDLSRFKDVSLFHILTNSTGIKWPGPDTPSAPLLSIKELGTMEILHPPGEKSLYKPDSFIIVWIVEKLTGSSFENFIQKEIFDKLGITSYELSLYEKRGPRLLISSRDILKFGQLYLNKGSYKGEIVLEESFINRVFQEYYSVDFPESGQYGLLWWLNNFHGLKACYAAGMGGQYLCIIPEREIIILTTGSLDHNGEYHKSLIRSYFQWEKIYERGYGDMKKSPVQFDREQKSIMVEKIISFFDDELELEIGQLKTDMLLDFMIDTVGKEIFNKGISQSREYLLKKMEDIELDMDQLLL